jgi:hypothetical protein
MLDAGLSVRTVSRYEQLAAPTEELKPVFASGRSAHSLPILRPPASPAASLARTFSRISRANGALSLSRGKSGRLVHNPRAPK